jgi:hypothetical protein
MSNQNPQITTVEVGIRSLREVMIFPLSIADQGKMAKILSEVFQAVMTSLSHLSEEEDIPDESSGTIGAVTAQLSNIDIAGVIVGIVQENLEVVLKLVVDPHEKITMEELTNEQFYKLVEVIYEVNYENASKNFPALFMRAKNVGPKRETPEKKVRRKVSHSRKPSPGSADGTITD